MHLADDDGGRHGEGYRSRRGDSLQDTDGSRGALQDRSHYGAEQDTQDGIAEHEENLLEGRRIFQRCKSRLHGGHAEKEDAEADQQVSDVFGLPVLTDQDHKGADGYDDGGKGSGLDQLKKQLRTGQITETQDLAGDGCTDVGAHDDRNGLSKLHDAGVYETDQHDCGGGRALNNAGDHSAQGKAL